MVAIVNLPRGAPARPPPGPREKRLRRARRCISFPASASVRTTPQNAPLRSVEGQFWAVVGPA
eukprot:429691-Alexandrium_andersonii.AAC.1